MKVPLEPIPTEQIVIVKQKPPSGELRAGNTRQLGGITGMGSGYPAAEDKRAEGGQLEKAYPWLLGASTCLCALLCWMYVTKPVIIQETEDSTVGYVAPQVASQEPKNVSEKKSTKPPADADLAPSDSQLPSSTNKPVASLKSTPEKIDPRMLTKAQRDAAERGVAAGWERTNLKVQHILSADAGSGEHEKIVINVPVLYETRSMRWTPEQIEKAREVLGRLMLYERSLSNLRKEGTEILADWNQIIKDTVPAESLRADSPSLPYNHGQGVDPVALPGSATAIQVEDK